MIAVHVKPKNKKFQDIQGQRFGRLLAVEYAGNVCKGTSWRCLCDCGNEKIVRGSALKSGLTRSCGCLHSESARNQCLKRTTHGMRNTTEWISWCAMIQRCTNKNRDNYEYYGGRGITVCDRWLESFESFLADMGKKPTKKHSIERLDPDKGYVKENCLWATKETQARNRTDRKRFKYDGKLLLLCEISKMCGISLYTLQNRVNVLGWSVERAAHTPKREYSKTRR